MANLEHRRETETRNQLHVVRGGLHEYLLTHEWRHKHPFGIGGRYVRTWRTTDHDAEEIEQRKLSVYEFTEELQTGRTVGDLRLSRKAKLIHEVAGEPRLPEDKQTLTESYAGLDALKESGRGQANAQLDYFSEPHVITAWHPGFGENGGRWKVAVHPDQKLDAALSIATKAERMQATAQKGLTRVGARVERKRLTDESETEETPIAGRR